VTAPSELCLDDSYELQIRRYVKDEFGTGMLYVLRDAAGPSPCRWEVNRIRSAVYDAVIRRRRDDQIVATAREVSVTVGGLSELRLEFAQVELEGTIRLNGQPAANVQLFVQGPAMNTWQVPLQEEGSYHVALPVSDGEPHFCIWLESARSQPIGLFHVTCQNFAPGLNRFDPDVQLPPGLIRVAVTPFGRPVPNDWTSLIVVISGAHEASSAGFKATAGFNGEYLGGEFGDYDVSIQTVPGHRILSHSAVVLSPDRPIGRVMLTIPTGSLGCNDGWWSAC
jgi:hypothetical protein